MHTKFPIGEHLNARRHLLNDDTVALIQRYYDAHKNYSLRLELTRQIATLFEIPNERRTTRLQLKETVSQVLWCFERMRAIDEIGLSEGAVVVFENDSTKTGHRVLKIRKDFLLQIEGIEKPTNPYGLQLAA